MWDPWSILDLPAQNPYDIVDIGKITVDKFYVDMYQYLLKSCCIYIGVMVMEYVPIPIKFDKVIKIAIKYFYATFQVNTNIIRWFIGKKTLFRKGAC